MFSTIEYNYREEKRNAKDDATVQESFASKGTRTEAAIFVGLKDRGQWIQFNPITIFLGRETERINQRSRIHVQLDTEPYQELQVTILGCHGRDNQSPRHGQESCHENQYGRHEKPDVERPGKLARKDHVRIYQQEHGILNQETNQVTCNCADRYDQSREIDLAEDASVGTEDVIAGTKALGEIPPQGNTGHIEHRLRNLVGRNTRQNTKHEPVPDGREQRLYQEP